MTRFRQIVLSVLAGIGAYAADNPPGGQTKAPVLQKVEPSDPIMVTLPGAPAKRVAPAPPPAAPALEPPELPKSPVTVALEKEVAVFCQNLIGQWTEGDAEQLLGRPLRYRPSFDEKKTVNGKIFTFADASGRYRELELDFEQETGTLRTVFAYPKWMTWQECRRRWNGEVSEANASQGRTFYSYLNRRLDVLVDAKGRVISLGLY